MKRLLRMMALSAITLAAPASARPLSTVGIRGTWHVVAAEYMEPSGVQAYSTAELNSSIGGELIIDAASARWKLSVRSKKALAGQDAFNKPCMRPTVRGLGDDQYELLCRGNSNFSPGMTMLMDGTLVLMMDAAEFHLRKDQ